MTFGKIFKRRKTIDLTRNNSIKKIILKNMEIRKSKATKKREKIAIDMLS